MSGSGLDGEREFFATGVRTYVEVDDAMTEFRSLVQKKCRAVVNGRLEEINQACDMRWRTNDLNDYLQKTNDHLFVGAMLEVKGLGGLYFCLRFSRKDEGERSDASAFLYRLRRDLADGLFDRFASTSETSYNRSNIVFLQRFSGDNTPDFENCLGRAIPDFLAFINESGGLKKYLAPGS
jgi:hypothetical protein